MFSKEQLYINLIPEVENTRLSAGEYHRECIPHWGFLLSLFYAFAEFNEHVGPSYFSDIISIQYCW